MKSGLRILNFALTCIGLVQLSFADLSPTDRHIRFSPYNWYLNGNEFAQTSNPGAYMKVGFSGTRVSVKVDLGPLIEAKVPASQYPKIRFSVDGGPGTTLQLTSTSESISCASNLTKGNHSLLLEYVAGYVFLDFWSPVNVLRVSGIQLDKNSALSQPSGANEPKKRHALFLGDSITNGDDDIANFKDGITNAVDTQDATIGYPAIVSAGLGSEYGIVAYGGASWDGTAADGHTPGLMSFFSSLDRVHTRLAGDKFSPIPDDIFVNMGENSGPKDGDVAKLLSSLRSASSPATRIFLIVPFSGRSRRPLVSGLKAYELLAKDDRNTYLLDIGNCPYLTNAGPTLFSVDGQHPLATLHSMLAAKILEERSRLLSARAVR